MLYQLGRRTLIFLLDFLVFRDIILHMPEVEFKTEQEKDKFRHWVEEKELAGTAEQIDIIRMPSGDNYYVYQIDGEIAVIFENGVLNYNWDRAYLGEVHTSELKSAGVIFEREKSPHEDLPGGSSLGSQSTKGLNVGDQV